MNQIYKNCQSCGMPLKKDEDRGTDANGSRSALYCVHCWKDGKYTMPDITVEEMKARVKVKIKEFGMPGFLAFFFTRKIPTLARWKK